MAAYIEQMPDSKPTIKQKLAAILMEEEVFPPAPLPEINQKLVFALQCFLNASCLAKLYLQPPHRKRSYGRQANLLRAAPFRWLFPSFVACGAEAALRSLLLRIKLLRTSWRRRALHDLRRYAPQAELWVCHAQVLWRWHQPYDTLTEHVSSIER
jgi:hypothetical protein